MLQDSSSLTATTQPTVPTDIEETLSFDPETGTFTFASVTENIIGAFQISMASIGTVTINAGTGIEFMPVSSNPVGFLPFNDSGAVEIRSVTGSQIVLDVTQLPSRSGVLGFLLFVQTTNGSPTIQGIETTPFFITQDQSFTAPEYRLYYDLATGDFQIREGGSAIGLPIPIEKGVVLLRLGPGDVEAITVILDESAISEGIIFAEIPAVFTAPPGLTGPTARRDSDTEITITQAFTPGTGFGVSFGVEVPTGVQPCTVYSPDPIIIDKQIGTGGEGNTR